MPNKSKNVKKGKFGFRTPRKREVVEVRLALRNYLKNAELSLPPKFIDLKYKQVKKIKTHFRNLPS